MQQCRQIGEQVLADDQIDPQAEALFIERLRAGEEEAYESLLARFQQPEIGRAHV